MQLSVKLGVLAIVGGTAALVLAGVPALASSHTASKSSTSKLPYTYLVESANQSTSDGDVGTTTVFCRGSDKATGGGGEVNFGTNPPSLAASHLQLVESYPFNSSLRATGWTVSYRNTDSTTGEFEEWVAYVTCLHVG
jgi:hypothetical protein